LSLLLRFLLEDLVRESLYLRQLSLQILNLLQRLIDRCERILHFRFLSGKIPLQIRYGPLICYSIRSLVSRLHTEIEKAKITVENGVEDLVMTLRWGFTG